MTATIHPDPTAHPDLALLTDLYTGLLLGTALGDSIGLPAEGLSRERVRARFPRPHRQRFIFGRGVISDDTEHAAFTANALIEHTSESDFGKRLARSFRRWMLTMPPGIGFATLRAGIKLWCGVSPEKSGVHSAGNGPAMRAPVIGAYCAAVGHTKDLETIVERSTRLTHTDSRASVGARAIARVAARIVHARQEGHRDPVRVSIEWDNRRADGDAEWQERITEVERVLAGGGSLADVADALGNEGGVTGYMYSTVPVVLAALKIHGDDFEACVSALIECGGDTDTTAAIAGALCGLGLGEPGLPESWLRGFVDVPVGEGYLRDVAAGLARRCESGTPAPRHRSAAVLLRPIRWLIVVGAIVVHIGLRLAPMPRRR